MALTRPISTARGLVAGAVWLGLVVGMIAAPPPVAAQTIPAEGFADLVERVAPAVVNISTTRRVDGVEGPQFPVPQFPPGSPFEDFFRDFFGQNPDGGPSDRPTPRESFSLGSGFVVDPSGYVVTNNHVIAEADEIRVIFSDNSEFPATLVGRDPKTDLAVLKIEADEPFPALEWADSDEIRVGQLMIAIGNPFGLGSTVTSGIVSARGRDIRAGPYDDFIQVDAAINRGNSGGPSFTIDGRVFGVNTAIFSPSGGNVGIGFAIPSNLARPVIDSLIADGRVVRGWLGVRIQSVTPEIAESLGLPDDDGALVASVTPGGPAADAGIEAGDVIVEFDGKRIERMRGLPRIVAETPVGKAVDVEIFRRGESATIQATLGELPSDEELAQLGDTRGGEQAPTVDRAELTSLGLTVAALTPELRENFQLPPEAGGVVIVEVTGGSPAAEENLRPGDLILEVGQETVSSPPELTAKVSEAQGSGKRSVLLLVDRQGDLRFVALRFTS
ncbi:MAG: DegQ family serine endoprotease [Pseudomonadota bacterium]